MTQQELVLPKGWAECHLDQLRLNKSKSIQPNKTKNELFANFMQGFKNTPIESYKTNFINNFSLPKTNQTNVSLSYINIENPNKLEQANSKILSNLEQNKFNKSYI